VFRAVKELLGREFLLKSCLTADVVSNGAHSGVDISGMAPLGQLDGLGGTLGEVNTPVEGFGDLLSELAGWAGLHLLSVYESLVELVLDTLECFI